MIGRRHEDLSSGDESDLLAVGGQVELGDLAAHIDEPNVIVARIGGHQDIDLLTRVGSCPSDPDFPVEGVAEIAFG